jgi:hypothetical protein
MGKANDSERRKAEREDAEYEEEEMKSVRNMEGGRSRECRRKEMNTFYGEDKKKISIGVRRI